VLILIISRRSDIDKAAGVDHCVYKLLLLSIKAFIKDSDISLCFEFVEPFCTETVYFQFGLGRYAHNLEKSSWFFVFASR